MMSSEWISSIVATLVSLVILCLMGVASKWGRGKNEGQKACFSKSSERILTLLGIIILGGFGSLPLYFGIQTKDIVSILLGLFGICVVAFWIYCFFKACARYEWDDQEICYISPLGKSTLRWQEIVHYRLSGDGFYILYDHSGKSITVDWTLIDPGDPLFKVVQKFLAEQNIEVIKRWFR